jgi:release factor glutamine methyltransferase
MTTSPATSGASIAAVLAGNPIGSLETRILLGHVLQLSRVQLITQSARTLTADEATRLSELIRRRIDGEPIAYLVGSREFYGLQLEVTPDVLIPRPETELLVELAAEYLPDDGTALDLGTGSGAIAVALAHLRRDAIVTAVDRSGPALSIARKNAARHGVAIHFLCSDWYQEVAGMFDVIAANPPYIERGDPHLAQGDLRFEPADALTDHDDGLSAIRIIVSQGKRYLKPGGRLLVEHGYDQAAKVRALFQEGGFEEVRSWADLAGIERVSGGAAPGSSSHGAAL